MYFINTVRRRTSKATDYQPLQAENTNPRTRQVSQRFQRLAAGVKRSNIGIVWLKKYPKYLIFLYNNPQIELRISIRLRYNKCFILKFSNNNRSKLLKSTYSYFTYRFAFHMYVIFEPFIIHIPQIYTHSFSHLHFGFDIRLSQPVRGTSARHLRCRQCINVSQLEWMCRSDVNPFHTRTL